MVNRILGVGPRPLGLDSRAYSQIPNAPQLEEEPDRLRRIAEVQEAKHPAATLRRVAGYYNCFGMVFGGRRTGITGLDGELDQIFREDRYRKIPIAEVQPGDLVLYLHEGSIQHVALVISVGVWDARGQRRLVQVLSKWGWQGPEFVHEMNDFELGEPREFWTDRE